MDQGNNVHVLLTPTCPLGTAPQMPAPLSFVAVGEAAVRKATSRVVGNAESVRSLES